MVYTIQEWKTELEKRFGDNFMNYAFVCPACGKRSTIRDFINAGAEADDSYCNCIGRFTGKGAPSKDSEEGCNK